MSSCGTGNPSSDHDERMPRRLRFNKGRDCIKCKANPGKIAIRHAVYCKECFTPLVTLKFRRSLEPHVNAHAGTSKRPKLKASGSLVVGYSGGLGSSVLLDMVHKTYFTDELSPNDNLRGGTKHPRSADVWASCAICYVEVCSAFPEAYDRTKDIMDTLAFYPNFDFVPLRIEYAFDDSWWRSVSTVDQDSSRLAIELGKDGLFTEVLRHAPTRDTTPVDALRTYLESLPTQTAVSSAIRILVRLLLLYTARSRGASHLLLGTSLTSLSISLISCISRGGGHSILEEIQEVWQSGTPATKNNEDAIRVVRPLRDVTMKECSMFAWWNAIRVVGRDNQTRATAGITGLTKDFIVGLEKDYPSTVSTIVRTCAKLEPKSASQGVCIICQCSIQAGLDDWKNRIAIGSYLDTKLLGPDLIHMPIPAPSDDSDATGTNNEHASITRDLCYSCRTMFTSKGTRGSKSTPSNVVPGGLISLSAPLPLWASARPAQPHTRDGQLMVSGNGELWVRERLDEEKRRRNVADFLLDD